MLQALGFCFPGAPYPMHQVLHHCACVEARSNGLPPLGHRQKEQEANRAPTGAARKRGAPYANPSSPAQG